MGRVKEREDSERKEQRRGYTESNQSSNSQGIIRTSDASQLCTFNFDEQTSVQHIV